MFAFTFGMDPVLSIGPFSVRWYGVFITLSIIVLLVWGLLQVRRTPGITNNMILTTALVGIPSGIIVSRLMHVIDLWDYYGQHLNEIIGGSGLTAWGAILGATLGAWIYTRFSKIPFGRIADALAPGVILAQAVGRVGCTINGCCYGTETSLPWAIVYMHPDSFGPLGIPVHPTTVYEIVVNLIIFGILLSLRGRLKPAGSLFLVYFSLYSLWRLGGDFMRDGTPFLFGLHEAQVISIIVLLITIPTLAYRTRWVKKEESEAKVSTVP